MPSPRQLLLEAVAQCLQRITEAGGYRTNAGQWVTLEPAPKLAEEREAFVAVTWSRQQRSAEPAVRNTHRLTTLEVIAKIPATIANVQERLDAITADIEDAMADQQFRYPPGYQHPQYESAEPLAAAFTAGWVGVVITYTSHIPKQPPATP